MLKKALQVCVCECERAREEQMISSIYSCIHTVRLQVFVEVKKTTAKSPDPLIYLNRALMKDRLLCLFVGSVLYRSSSLLEQFLNLNLRDRSNYRTHNI